MKKVIYNSEEEFLKAYNKDEYERLSITADIVIFSVSNGKKENYRRLNEKFFSILLVKRNDYPFKDKWCLPGGFVGIDETIEEAAKRILKNETNLNNMYLEQLYTNSDVNRDPRMRVISTSYITLIDKDKLSYKLSNNASWFNVKINESINKLQIELDNGIELLSFEINKTIVDKTTNICKYNIVKNDCIAFDHPVIIVNAIERLKNKIEYTDIVFNMMPKYFTLGELQQVYEVILGKKLLDPAFRRIISSKVEKTNKVKTGDGHRPSILYKYKNK